MPLCLPALPASSRCLGPALCACTHPQATSCLLLPRADPRQSKRQREPGVRAPVLRPAALLHHRGKLGGIGRGTPAGDAPCTCRVGWHEAPGAAARSSSPTCLHLTPSSHHARPSHHPFPCRRSWRTSSARCTRPAGGSMSSSRVSWHTMSLLWKWRPALQPPAYCPASKPSPSHPRQLLCSSHPCCSQGHRCCGSET